MVASIVGDSNFNDYYEFCCFIYNVCKKNKLKITHIVTGDTKGVDTMAIQYALDNNLTFYIYKANWSGLGKAAIPIRDKDIITNSQFCIIFNGDSVKYTRSTKNYINNCKKQNKKYFIFPNIEPLEQTKSIIESI